MKKNKLWKTIIFLIVLLIPIIYSFFFLKSYWDPYGNLTGMKIAIVNLDIGENQENEGKEFIQNLEESHVFQICEVNKEEAEKGMQKGEYYATITIPSSFTQELNSASEENKQIATITYSPNQAANYLATQIINSSVKTMELELEEKINGKITENLASKLEEVPKDLEKTEEGANELLQGSKDLHTGLQQLTEGENSLNQSYSQLDKGIQSATEGSQTLYAGIQQVNDGVENLQEGASDLENVISQVNASVGQLSSQSTSKITELTTGVERVNTGTQYFGQMLTSYIQQNEQLINTMIQAIQTQQEEPDEATQKLVAQANLLVASGTDLLNNATKVCEGTQTLQEEAGAFTSLGEKITKLEQVLTQVEGGTQTLKAGIQALEDGTQPVEMGSKDLTAGLTTLSTGSSQVKMALDTLQSGTETAYNGSTKLVEGIETFDTEIREGIADTKEQLKSVDGIDEFAKNPVNFQTEAYGEVNSYGIAFTPLFLSIGLWVGALMCYVVFYYDQKNRFGILGSNHKNKLLQNAIYIFIGIMEGLLTGALLKIGLGYEVENVGWYYMASALIGVTFMSIIQFLIRNFGDVGKFAALIILVFQLAASGGTFPVETINEGFQSLTAYLPMTYSIKLLREILVPTATNLKGTYIAILCIITAVTILLTYVVDMVKVAKEKKKVA